MLVGHHGSAVAAGREDWRARAQIDHPSFKEARERALPIPRAVSFGRAFLPEYRYLPPGAVFALIEQHLRTVGLLESEAAVHAEWPDTAQIPSHLSESQLVLLLERGLMRCERLWRLADGDELDEEISRTIGGIPVVSEAVDEPLIGDLVVDASGRLQGTTLPKLIELLTDHCDIDVSGVAEALCLTYSALVSAKEMWMRLRERVLAAVEERRGFVVKRTFRLIEMWWRENYDELEPAIVESVRELARAHLKTLDLELFLRFEKMDTASEPVEELKKPPLVKLGNATLWGEFKLLDLPADELARQLTVWTAERFYAIKKTELMNGNWSNPRMAHRAPNVVALVKHGEIVGKWVASSVLAERGLDNRLRLWDYFVQLMRALWNCGNFCDAFAVYTGLWENSAMERLKIHRKMLPAADRRFLGEVQGVYTGGGMSWQRIRKKQIDHRKSGKPTLPYLAVLLADLRSHNEATPNKVNGLLNVAKCVTMYKLIRAIDEFKEPKFNFLPILQAQEVLGKLPVMEEDGMKVLSMEIEPEGATESTVLAMRDV